MTRTLITIDCPTREAWLAERRNGIGGSDAAAAVGMSKWKTPLELYMEKRGESETAETEPMRWGNLLEPVVRQEYSNRTGRTVVVPAAIVVHPTVPFARMTPDGIADESRVLQVKTARTADGWGEPGSSEVPQDYLIQTQHEMFVTGLPVADIAVLIGGSDFRIYEIPADPELQEMLIAQEAEFWAAVQAAEPPAPVDREDVKRRWRISRGTSVGADAGIMAAADTLATVRAIKDAAESKAEELAAVIQDYMADAGTLTFGGDTVATWDNINASRKFDLERFREEQPELFKEYLRDATPQRRFLLKLKGPKPCLTTILTSQAKRLEETAT